MAHSRTAKKNIRKTEKRRAENRKRLSAIRTQAKSIRKAVEAKDTATAGAGFSHLQKLVDKGAKTHRLHPNKAARLKSRLGRLVAAASKGAAAGGTTPPAGDTPSAT